MLFVIFNMENLRIINPNVEEFKDIKEDIIYKRISGGDDIESTWINTKTGDIEVFNNWDKNSLEKLKEFLIGEYIILSFFGITENDRITHIYYGKIKDIILNHEDFLPQLRGAFVISTFISQPGERKFQLSTNKPATVLYVGDFLDELRVISETELEELKLYTGLTIPFSDYINDYIYYG